MLEKVVLEPDDDTIEVTFDRAASHNICEFCARFLAIRYELFRSNSDGSLQCGFVEEVWGLQNQRLTLSQPQRVNEKEATGEIPATYGVR